MGNLKDRFDINGQKIDQYNDSEMRNELVISLEKITGGQYISTTISQYDFDITDINNPNIMYEGEWGISWKGERWTQSNQSDLFNTGFNTLNIPERKFYAWGYPSRRHPEYINRYKPNLNVHYVRANSDFSQICIIESDIIRNPNNVFFVYDKMVGNSTKLEDWICIKEELVKTYNLQPNGLWLLSTGQNGDYHQRNRIKELKELAELKK
jgi:hypothetical protein